MADPDATRMPDDVPAADDLGLGAFEQDLDASFDELSDAAAFANAYTEEIENVTASDWDLDADELWGGGEQVIDLSADPGPTPYDFPL